MLKDERGISITIFSMFIATLMLIGIYLTLDFSKTVQEYDVNLQSSVGEAVRNAALMVDKESLALGKPLINHELAHKTFLKILEKRVPNGEIEDYFLVVFNHGYGAENKMYLYEKGISTPSEGSSNEEAQTFYISPDGINLSSGEASATLDEPGCIALVKLKTDSLIGKESDVGARWAVSTIVLSKDLY